MVVLGGWRGFKQGTPVFHLVFTSFVHVSLRRSLDSRVAEVGEHPCPLLLREGPAARSDLQRDWYFIAEQPAPAPHLAHPEECAALRIVLVTVPRVS